MAADDPELEFFREAAVEWAAGGRGQTLVDAATNALAAGLDSPTLRILAGAPRAAADDEANELASVLFDELGLEINPRLSEAAIVEAARLEAKRFLESSGSPRDLARNLWRMSVAAGYPNELADWSGFDDWYDMLHTGVIQGRVEDVDAAVIESARALVDGTAGIPAALDELSARSESTLRSGIMKALKRRR